MTVAGGMRTALAAVVVPMTFAQVYFDIRAIDYLIAAVLIGLVGLSERGRRGANRARIEFARREEQMSYTQAAAGVGSWEAHEDGSESWSPTFCDLLGLPAGVAGSTQLFRSLVLHEDYDTVLAADEAMLNVEGEHEFEYRINRNGETRWLLARGRCVQTGSKTLVHGVALDITERKQQEHQLLQAQKLETIGRLAGGVAHDFNNLLTGIFGYADLARARAERGAAPLAEIEEIRAAAERAAGLTQQLLAFSRKQVMAEETLDLNEIVRRTEGLLGRVIGEDIRVTHNLRREHVLVRGDRTQLEQVLLNLVVNARDAMPDGGAVTIDVDEVAVDSRHALELDAGRYALLAVSDTGCGLPPESLAEIFEPFFTTKADGTGLGLATVHGIVKQSGGAIWPYSEPGAGTTFKIYLPLADAAAPAPAAPVAAPKPHGTGERVLVVEDDRQVRMVVKAMLAARGFDVTTAPDPAAAITVAQSGVRFDVILSDLVMPDKTGRELVAELRVFQPSARVMFMSGYSDDAVRTRGAIDPGTSFIEKPFSSDDLVEHIRTLLAA